MHRVPLGRGGQGWTATAVEKASGETKVIKSVACDNIKAGNIALQEAKVLQALDHVNIVRYIDVFLHKEKSRQELLVCTVMEYCEGGDLAKRYVHVRNFAPHILLVRRHRTLHMLSFAMPLTSSANRQNTGH